MENPWHRRVCVLARTRAVSKVEKHIRHMQVPLLGLFQPLLALSCIPTPLEIDCNPEPSARGWLTEGEEKKIFCCFFSGKNRSINPVLADICILSPSPTPLLSYFIQSLSDGNVNPFILPSREASCPRGNLQGFPWTLWMLRVWEIQICSHISMITYKQSRFSLEDKKYSKSFRCGQLLLRGILDQELAHQPLSFACLLGGPR